MTVTEFGNYGDSNRIFTFASPPASACTAATTGTLGPDRISQMVYDNADQVTKQQVAVAVNYGDSRLNALNSHRTSPELQNLTLCRLTRFPEQVWTRPPQVLPTLPLPVPERNC